MGESSLPSIEPIALERWPAPIAAWQHGGPSGQFRVRIDLVRDVGRTNAVPDVALTYQTGDSAGPFGLGWSLKLPEIVRGDGRRLPRYRDHGPEADSFTTSEAGELVPALARRGDRWQPDPPAGLNAIRFRPRVDSTPRFF